MKCLLCEGWIISRENLFCNKHLEEGSKIEWLKVN